MKIFRSTIGPIADHRRVSGNSIDTNARGQLAAAEGSAADAVAEVDDATLTFEYSDPLQLALVGAEVLE